MNDQNAPVSAPTDSTRGRISAVLCVFNEERRIARCLDALVWCDEVVVVDRFSRDDTGAISKSYPNVRFLQREDWLNPNINFGFEQATGDWILRIDCDEIVSPEMALEIQNEILSGKDVRFNGFWAPNRVYFFGKWLKYGVAFDPRSDRPGYGYRKVLFRKGMARYDCKLYHEDLTTQGEFGRLKHHYEHYSHTTVSGWIGKMNDYTTGDAENSDVLSPEFRLPKPGKTVAAMLKMFIVYFILHKGYRDGIYGFMTSGMNTMYLFVDRCKLWEKHYRLTHADEIVRY